VFISFLIDHGLYRVQIVITVIRDDFIRDGLHVVKLIALGVLDCDAAAMGR
jgi:hypothetical protein